MKTIIYMIIFLTIFIGGFTYFAVQAAKMEKNKEKE